MELNESNLLKMSTAKLFQNFMIVASLRLVPPFDWWMLKVDISI